MVCINGRIVHIRQHQRELHTSVPVLRWPTFPRMFEVKRGEFGLVSVREKEDAPILESDPMPAQSHKSQIPAKRFQILTTESHRIGRWVRVTCAPSFASLTSAMCCGLRLGFRGPGSWGGPLPSSPRLCPSSWLATTQYRQANRVYIFSRAISFRCPALSSSPVKPPSCLWFRERKKSNKEHTIICGRCGLRLVGS